MSKPQGFNLMDPARQREIASMGGKAVSRESRSFSTNRKLAQEAGRKGGLAVPASKRTFSDPAKAAEAGRKGGIAVRSETRSFYRDRKLAREAGRKGGLASHGIGTPPYGLPKV